MGPTKPSEETNLAMKRWVIKPVWNGLSSVLARTRRDSILVNILASQLTREIDGQFRKSEEVPDLGSRTRRVSFQEGDWSIQSIVVECSAWPRTASLVRARCTPPDLLGRECITVRRIVERELTSLQR